MALDPILSSMMSNARRNSFVSHIYKGDEDIAFPNVTLEPLSWGASNTGFDSHMAVVNNDEGRVITVVTDSYAIIDHRQLIEQADDMVMRTFHKPMERETLMINNGDKMLAAYKLSDCPITLGSGDDIFPTLILKNSYDLGWSASIMGGVFRLVCTNGAYVGHEEKVKRRHVGDVANDFVLTSLNGIIKNIPILQKRLTEWQSEKISKNTKLNMKSIGLNDGELQSLLYQKERTSGLHIEAKTIENSKGKEETVYSPVDDCNKYSLWNLMTEFATHRIANPVRRDSISSNISSVFERNAIALAS